MIKGLIILFPRTNAGFINFVMGNYSPTNLERKILVGLRENDFKFAVADRNQIAVNHLIIAINSNGAYVKGNGIRATFKEIDFRYNPRLEDEIVEEVLGYLKNPQRRSPNLLAQFLRWLKS